MADKLVSVSLTLTEAQVQYLDKRGAQNDLKRSQYVRRLIRNDMEITAKVKA